MGHESQIELWSPNLTTFCFVGFGTDRLRRQEAMITAGRENPNQGVVLPRDRAHGAVGQNRSRSIKWAEKQQKFQPKDVCFFLTSPFIELTRTYSTCDAALERSTQLEQSPEILLAASCPSALTSGSLGVFISDRPNHFPLPSVGEARRRQHGRRVPGGRYTSRTPSRVEAAGWGFVTVKPGGG